MSYFGEVLETARRARGLTRSQLADLAGVNESLIISYERGLESGPPDPALARRTAVALRITPELMAGSGRVHGAIGVDVHMRRRASASPTVWRRAEAQLNMHRLHAARLFEEISLRADQIVPRFDPMDVSPTAAARLTRMQWRIPVGPVRALIQWMEAAGCLVIDEDLGTPRIDGVAQWSGDHPVVLLNSRVPTDRRRWTLAHEIGHLCLHDLVSNEMEQEADEFAAEFLMPADLIGPQLRTVSLGRLLDLKRQWGVSVQALIRRAHDLGRIGEEQRDQLYRSLSARGWRQHEPVSDELAAEQVELTRRIGRELTAKGLGAEEIARLAGYADASCDHPFCPSPPRLRAV